MTDWLISGSLGFVSGGALIWLCKSEIQQIVIGANAVSAKPPCRSRRHRGDGQESLM